MMIRTHLAITALLVLILLQYVSGWGDKIVFVAVALLATYLPDIDSGFSTIGRKFPAKIVQFFVRHRTLLHSFTFLLPVSLIFALVLPVLALPFFVGYGLHLLADSFTIEGIMPFWPYSRKSSGILRTGSVKETSVFVFFILLNVFVLLMFIKSVF